MEARLQEVQPQQCSGNSHFETLNQWQFAHEASVAVIAASPCPVPSQALYFRRQSNSVIRLRLCGKNLSLLLVWHAKCCMTVNATFYIKNAARC